VLRYLSDAYRAMRQTVPESARTDEVDDLTAWLGELVRQTDSSLLDEWEQLTSPGGVTEPLRPGTGRLDEAPPPVTANKRAFRVLVRNALFRRVELAALRRYDELGELDADAGWDERVESADRLRPRRRHVRHVGGEDLTQPVDTRRTPEPLVLGDPALDP
jgi:hypothetical protein